MDSGSKFKRFLADDQETGKPGRLSQLGLSVEQFATACGLTRSSVYYYLKGTCHPSSKTMHKMAEVLNIPVEEMLSALPTREEGRQRKKIRG